MSENQEKTLCGFVLERMVRFLLKLKPELVLVSGTRDYSESVDCVETVVTLKLRLVLKFAQKPWPARWPGQATIVACLVARYK